MKRPIPSAVVWPEPVTTSAVSATGLALLSTLSAPLGAAVLALGSLGLVAGLVSRTPRGGPGSARRRGPDLAWGVLASLIGYLVAPALPVWLRSFAIALALIGFAGSRSRARFL